MSLNTRATPLLPHKILVIGGAYAGLSLVHNLLRQVKGLETDGTPSATAACSRRPLEITILDERDGFYHTIGSPLSFACKAYSPKIWKTYDDIPKLRYPGVSVVRGRVTGVDPEKRIATYLPTDSTQSKTQAYDYLAVCTGLRRSWPVVPKELTKAKYLAETGDFIRGIEEADDGIIVIGAGAVGVEVAAELKQTHANTTIRIIHAHDKLLSNEPLPNEFKDRAKSILSALGVDLVLNERIIDVQKNPLSESKRETYTVKLQSGRSFQAGKVINAVSRGVPNTEFLPSSCLSPEKYVNLRPTLQFSPAIVNADFHFAAGDIANWSVIKRVGSAMAMGLNVAINMYRHILALEKLEVAPDQAPVETKLDEFPHEPAMIALACGDDAILYTPDGGIEQGEEVMNRFFGDDLGFSFCWSIMKLGEKYSAN